jgi:hypothetical protein
MRGEKMLTPQVARVEAHAAAQAEGRAEGARSPSFELRPVGQNWSVPS